MKALIVRVREEGEAREEQYAFLKSPVRIGRGELNDLPLASSYVSTFHGHVQFDDESATYVDLGSTNGSVLDGEALHKNDPRVIPPGAELVLGGYHLRFERSVVEKAVRVPRQSILELRRVRPPAGPAPKAEPGAPAAVPEHLAGDQGETPPAAPDPAGPSVVFDGPALEEADAALDVANLELDLSYAAYRSTCDHLLDEMEKVVAALGPAAREVALERFQTRFEAVRAEPRFAVLAGGARGAKPERRDEAASPARIDDPDQALAREALRQLREFAQSYLPAGAKLRGGQDVQLTLDRIARTLETYCRAFLDMRTGLEEFGRRLGVRSVQVEGVLLHVREVQPVLAYLLAPDAQDRENELQRAFAGFMAHQMALLGGVQEGAKAMLSALRPEEIESKAGVGIWPMRGQALWKEFERRYQELMEEEDGITELLFGREFAKAYRMSIGAKVAEVDGDERD